MTNLIAKVNSFAQPQQPKYYAWAYLRCVQRQSDQIYIINKLLMNIQFVSSYFFIWRYIYESRIKGN